MKKPAKLAFYLPHSTTLSLPVAVKK